MCAADEILSLSLIWQRGPARNRSSLKHGAKKSVHILLVRAGAGVRAKAVLRYVSTPQAPREREKVAAGLWKAKARERERERERERGGERECVSKKVLKRKVGVKGRKGTENCNFFALARLGVCVSVPASSCSSALSL